MYVVRVCVLYYEKVKDRYCWHVSLGPFLKITQKDETIIVEEGNRHFSLLTRIVFNNTFIVPFHMQHKYADIIININIRAKFFYYCDYIAICI